MFKKLLPLLFILTFAIAASAQDVEVDRYSISARIDIAASAIDARAQLSISNLSQSPKPRLFLRLAKLAKVSAVSIGGATAQFETAEDRRNPALNQLIITLAAPLVAGAKTTVDVTYRMEVPDSNALAAVYAGEMFCLPDSVWFPAPSTVFALTGAMTAPFTLAVTAPAGARAYSSGAMKSDNQTFTFDQPLNSIPFFIAGAFDPPAAFDHGGVKVEICLQTGLNTVEKDATAASKLSEEARRMIDYFTKLLGPPPAGASFRMISTARASTAAVPGAVVLGEQAFRQDTLDALTIERTADAMARLWTDGRVRVRGQEARQAQGNQAAQKARSAALLRDSLPRFLAALYIEDRYGKDAAAEVFSRMRWSYTPVAQSGRDAELGIQTPAQASYGAASLGKGPLVLRMLAQSMGRDKFISVLRALFAGAQNKIVTNEEFKQELAKTGGAETENLFRQWVETIIEPDLVIGIPQTTDNPSVQRVNLRNLGTGDVSVRVMAVAASGKQIAASVTVPSEALTSVDIQSAEKISSVEVDPEKLIIQTNYDNDAKPVRPWPQTLFNESIIAFNKGEYAQAEAKLKEALRLAPHNSLLRAWLARALAAQGKHDEAMNEAAAAIKTEPPTGGALAWARIAMAQSLVARGSNAEAVRHLRRALVEADEAPARFAAREALIRAERAANLIPPVDESVRAFISQLDSLFRQPSSDKLFAVVSRNNLKVFVQRLAVTPPTAWTTEILRADQIDANRVALEVSLRVKSQEADHTGTAIFLIYRAPSGWMLEDVQQFNVK
ncbi:MAG: tetratricopeptide repeat protein [Acidobacteriota bacterium]